MVSAAWDEQFATWAQAPSQTESEKIDNAIRAVRNALDADDKLRPLTTVFAQGSYRNRVNVRLDSDVDIGVLYTGPTILPAYPAGKTAKDFGLIDATYGYVEFKNDLHAALNRQFGSSKVGRGPKAFDIHENTYRVDADVVPLMIHRRYRADGTCVWDRTPDLIPAAASSTGLSACSTGRNGQRSTTSMGTPKTPEPRARIEAPCAS